MNQALEKIIDKKKKLVDGKFVLLTEDEKTALKAQIEANFTTKAALAAQRPR